MGPTSGCPSTATVNLYYCTRFSRICKQFFQENQNIFAGKKKKSPDTPYDSINTADYGIQKPVCGEPVQDHSSGGPGAHPQAQVSGTHGKIQPQQSPEQGQQEENVPKPGMPGPQGPEQTVYKNQLQAQKQGPAQLLQGLRRGHHPKKRLSQPPAAPGSS